MVSDLGWDFFLGSGFGFFGFGSRLGLCFFSMVLVSLVFWFLWLLWVLEFLWEGSENDTRS